VWYTFTILSNTPSKACFICGSELIVVSSDTTVINNSLFEQTTTVYRCSNKECQDAKDKESERRQKAYAEKKASELRRQGLKSQSKSA
jgi:hypothetical protein